ncbi:hypothetical protein E6C27_scaffold219G001920 [Cucumis melo var. makuwa]|uniref:Uncharacterized protein n=1 Tax=Cucumis melo var. makuwa TaxID=1194695 RepID=A0A5A7SPM2_CUCMM|nr:hypothetical protein E6C27_scaffold219G001920 [Cucumis melo var. makuwa]
MVQIGATKCTGQRPTKGKRRWASDDGRSSTLFVLLQPNSSVPSPDLLIHPPVTSPVESSESGEQLRRDVQYRELCPPRPVTFL